jgi:hypothetical protein
LRQRDSADLAASRDVVQQIGNFVPLRHQPAQHHQAGSVGLQPLSHVGHRTPGQFLLRSVRGRLELGDGVPHGHDPLPGPGKALDPDRLDDRAGVADVSHQQREQQGE